MSRWYPTNTSLALAGLNIRTGARKLQGQEDPPRQSVWVRSKLRRQSGGKDRHMSFICLFVQWRDIDVDRTTLKYRYMGLAGGKELWHKSGFHVLSR